MRNRLATGMRFGRWTLVDRAANDNGWSTRHLQVVCDCGTVGYVLGGNLGKASRSCGCLQRELVALRSTTHGRTKTTEYFIWKGMIGRCHRETDKDYPSYGARGITVCERWRKSFSDFLADMGERPGRDYTIDRADNSRGYEPGNCRWATQHQQQQNRRSTRLNPDMVREIRRRYASGETKASIARLFDVAYMTITFVVRNQTWSNVK